MKHRPVYLVNATSRVLCWDLRSLPRFRRTGYKIVSAKRWQQWTHHD
jgi:hypothetical protein